MVAPGEDGSIASELGDSKEEIEEIEEHYSEYSLEFDDDNEANRENSLDRSIKNNNNNNNNNNASSNNCNINASSSNNDNSSSSTQRQQQQQQQQGSAAAAFEANAGKEQGSDEQPSPPQSPQPARQRSPPAADSSRSSYGGPANTIPRRSTPPITQQSRGGEDIRGGSTPPTSPQANRDDSGGIRGPPVVYSTGGSPPPATTPQHQGDIDIAAKATPQRATLEHRAGLGSGGGLLLDQRGRRQSKSLLSLGRKEPAPWGVEDGAGERDGRQDNALPAQFLALKQHLDVVGRIGQQQGLTAAEALATVAREHAALRECLDTIQEGLLMARRKRAEEKTARLAVVQIKRARAEARRAEYFEDLAETKRATVAAERAAEALHAKLGEKEAECRHAQELLATARSSASAAERRGEEWKHELETAKEEADGARKALAGARLELEQERTRGAVAAREAADNLKLYERKRELEVDAAIKAAEARDRVTQAQLAQLPEHQQQHLQAEMDRVARWEERLVAEAANLQRKEEAHKGAMEACRAQANRAEAESRGRADAEVARERASLREATSALEVERGELLQRAAKAEATGQAKAIEAVALKAEVTEARRRLEAEKTALDTRTALLAPQFLGLEEGRAAVESARREAREEARRARDEACRAREMEARVVEREAAVEVKWEETAGARRAVQQVRSQDITVDNPRGAAAGPAEASAVG